jgi:hypothetical protein
MVTEGAQDAFLDYDEISLFVCYLLEIKYSILIAVSGRKKANAIMPLAFVIPEPVGGQ